MSLNSGVTYVLDLYSTPKAWPALRADYPALLGAKRALRNSLATLGQTVLALIRFPPVVLGCTKGELVLRSRLLSPRAPWTPPSIAAAGGPKRGVSERPPGSEFPSAARREKRRAPRASGEGQVVGCPFFWVLFFGHAKKRIAGALRRALSKPTAHGPPTTVRTRVPDATSATIDGGAVCYDRALIPHPRRERPPR